MRLRTDRPKVTDIDSYTTAVVISWNFQPGVGGVKPPEDVWNRMEVYEDAVADLGWPPGCSYLLNINTGFGTREWLYYTKDRAEFMRQFNSILESHERYPLQVAFHDDPEWKMWRGYRVAYERQGNPPFVWPTSSKPNS